MLPKTITFLVVFASTYAVKFYAVEYSGKFWMLDSDAGTQTLLRSTSYDFQNIAGPDCFGRYFASSFSNAQLLEISERGISIVANFSSKKDLRGMTFGYNNELWGIVDTIANDTLHRISYANGITNVLSDYNRNCFSCFNPVHRQ